MVNKNKQPNNTSRALNYLWFLSLIGTGVLFWWVNNWLSLLVAIWLFIAYFTIAVVRGGYFSLPVLAALYMLAFVVCEFLLGVRLIPLSMSSKVNPMGIIGPMAVLDMLLAVSFVAYFCYKKEILVRKVQKVPFREHFFIAIFWLLLGGIATFNLYGILGAQASNPSIVSVGFLIELAAAGVGIVGMKRASWRWLCVSLVLF